MSEGYSLVPHASRMDDGARPLVFVNLRWIQCVRQIARYPSHAMSMAEELFWTFTLDRERMTVHLLVPPEHRNEVGSKILGELDPVPQCELQECGRVL